MTPDQHAAEALRLIAEANPVLPEYAAVNVAKAQVHATLALAAKHEATDDSIEVGDLRAQLADLRNAEAAIVDQLNSYGQTFTGGSDEIVGRIGELMDLAYNQPGDGGTLRVVR
jgi:hypothetical protein